MVQNVPGVPGKTLRLRLVSDNRGHGVVLEGLVLDCLPIASSIFAELVWTLWGDYSHLRVLHQRGEEVWGPEGAGESLSHRVPGDGTPINSYCQERTAFGEGDEVGDELPLRQGPGFFFGASEEAVSCF